MTSHGLGNGTSYLHSNASNTTHYLKRSIENRKQTTSHHKQWNHKSRAHANVLIISSVHIRRDSSAQPFSAVWFVSSGVASTGGAEPTSPSGGSTDSTLESIGFISTFASVPFSSLSSISPRMGAIFKGAVISWMAPTAAAGTLDKGSPANGCWIRSGKLNILTSVNFAAVAARKYPSLISKPTRISDTQNGHTCIVFRAEMISSAWVPVKTKSIPDHEGYKQWNPLRSVSVTEPSEPSEHSDYNVSEKGFGNLSQYDWILWTVDWILKFNKLEAGIPE